MVLMRDQRFSNCALIRRGGNEGCSVRTNGVLRSPRSLDAVVTPPRAARTTRQAPQTEQKVA